MASDDEITKQMDGLEAEARAVLGNPDLSPFERRFAFERLLRDYRVLEDYQRALAAYVRQMLELEEVEVPDPEDVIQEILTSPEFALLRVAVLAAFIAIIFGNGNGPRLAWVPLAWVPMVATPGRWL